MITGSASLQYKGMRSTAELGAVQGTLIRNTSLTVKTFRIQVLTSCPDDPLNALFVYVSGKKLGTKPAWQRAYKTILSRFHDVITYSEFQQLDVDHVSEILSGDAIAARRCLPLFYFCLSLFPSFEFFEEIKSGIKMSSFRFAYFNYSRCFDLCRSFGAKLRKR